MRSRNKKYHKGSQTQIKLLSLESGWDWGRGGRGGWGIGSDSIIVDMDLKPIFLFYKSNLKSKYLLYCSPVSNRYQAQLGN